jgi:hypothetical protein
MDRTATKAQMLKRVRLLEKLDREAATHVESLICLRTDFTGNPPHVGWKGLGLALRQRLDALEDLVLAMADRKKLTGKQKRMIECSRINAPNRRRCP